MPPRPGGRQLAAFEEVAVMLWLAKGNLFYLLTFSYIGVSVALGVALFARGSWHACPMEVDMLDDAHSRENGTECILCLECVRACPKKAL